MSKKALLVIDIQNDYFENGAWELVGSKEASLKARKLMDYFRANKLPIANIQHLAADVNAPFFQPATFGVEIHENVKPHEGEKVIQKNYPNSFRDTELLEYLKANDVTELVITGMMSHMCVDATTRAAKDLGFECTVIADACASRDLELAGKTVKAEDVHTAFISALSFFYATVITAEEFLNA
ncbi:Nicotinamidase-related amidase [Flavobacterium anhuiense]|uniref:Nicotinamidase-related amidase n=1 Tax=Flavobacterium anhuiense TaxID=459526 RepID=A0ABY0LXC6_9FLAO|nr:cysteine hydrolase family protein [Flavobacterium anhuiense]SCY75862.1 Nicotinamidase-related amidase [Flavobacterium anhuiense]